ncbi:hypothetical protein [Mesorhizobium sp.]|uniref:hypothetical protein n=1 Tax=Mesorhizobium sp. TaxID=1871066 RepID=UPI000FE9B004|nr:hypothetical protein [Mesorhizobium sp.]RWP31944.1 MAG: hypothetical protein EOR03_21690 [Mesorhizobium sp.]
MIEVDDSVFTLFQLAKQKAPAYFQLLAAKNEAEFDLAFDAMIEGAVSQLEQNSKNYSKLNETGLTGVLAAALSIPGLTVTQETNSNGHVDLVIEADHCSPRRRKLGEAKIYNGPTYHVAGLDQLLNRYTTGREGRGLLIAYVRKKNIAGLVKDVRHHMDTELPCNQQGITVDHSLKWSFVSTHAHSCGEHLQVSHIGCNLFVGQGPDGSGGEA